MKGESRRQIVVPPQLDGRPLCSVLRTLAGMPWSRARQFVRTGKIWVRGERATRPERIVGAGESIEIVPSAPRPETEARLERGVVVYIDAHVVVVNKPAGVSTVPYEEGERGALDQLVAELIRRTTHRRGPPATLGVVQRLDRETTGVLVFARSFGAKKILAQQLRKHTVYRRYVAIAHGEVRGATFRTFLVKDRGDGLRGSSRRGEPGQLAVTHVEPVERLACATLVRCRLETGRTHQIRIHLAESGHPVVGEAVYVRDFTGDRIEAPRVMLHAAELGFTHPITGREMRFEAPPPADFEQTLAKLRAARSAKPAATGPRSSF
jgi:23S rRNA pseudouridine1911/1915/1917 synthase